MEDRARLFQLTARMQEELQRIRPDAVITWGPDGATGHPDHRLVSSVVTQLVRAGAPAVPERLFYVSLPVEGFRAMNPARGEPSFLIPLAKYFSARVPFSTADFEASRRSMACHKTQYSDEIVQKVSEATQSRIERGTAARSVVPDGCDERSIPMSRSQVLYFGGSKKAVRSGSNGSQSWYGRASYSFSAR